MLHVSTFRFNNFYENTYLAFDNTSACILIDPGMYTQEERSSIDQYIAFLQLRVQYIVLTHAHIDHILGLAYAMKKYNAPLLTHAGEYRNLPLVQKYAAQQGYVLNDIPGTVSLLQQGDHVQTGELSFEVLHTPGHTPNSISLYDQRHHKLFSGDVLFAHAIGNTYLPGGNSDQLMDTINNSIRSLPGETCCFPGHGSAFSIDYIKQSLQKGYYKGLTVQQAIPA